MYIHGTKGFRVATQIVEYRPLISTLKSTTLRLSPTAPKVERFCLSPVHTLHRLSEDNLES